MDTRYTQLANEEEQDDNFEMTELISEKAETSLRIESELDLNKDQRDDKPHVEHANKEIKEEGYRVKLYVWTSTRYCSKPWKTATYGHAAMLVPSFEGCGLRNTTAYKPFYISFNPGSFEDKDDFLLRYSIKRDFAISTWTLELPRDALIQLYTRFNELFKAYTVQDKNYYLVPEISSSKSGRALFHSRISCCSKENEHNCTSLIFDLLKAAGLDLLPCRRGNTILVSLAHLFNPTMLGYSIGTLFDLGNPNRGNPKRTLKPEIKYLFLVLLILSALFPTSTFCFSFRNCFGNLKKLFKRCYCTCRNGFSNAAIISMIFTGVITAFIAYKDGLSGNPFDITDDFMVAVGIATGILLCVVNVLLSCCYDTKNCLIRPSGLLGTVELRKEEEIGIKQLYAYSHHFNYTRYEAMSKETSVKRKKDIECQKKEESALESEPSFDINNEIIELVKNKVIETDNIPSATF